MNSYNTINYLNLLAACINIVLFTLDSNEDYGPDYDFFNRFNLRDLSRRYINGAMTPAEPFFVIFNIVSLFLSVFAMIQFLPAYRSLSMVQDGVGYWYFIGTVAQIFAFTFSVDNIEVSFVTSLLSTIFFSITCASTWKILHNQHHNATSDNSPEEYWLIRFPFQLQSGWNIALTTMSVNILFRGDINGGFSAVMNSILIIASLIVYAAISGKLLFFSGNVTPNYVIPSVIALVTLGIGFNTDNDEIMLMFCLYAISFFTVVGTVIKVYINEVRSKNATDSTDEEENDGSNYQPATTEVISSSDVNIDDPSSSASIMV